MNAGLRYLLDTNIVSEVIRQPRGTVAERIAAVGERTIGTSIVVASELRFGARKRGSSRLSQQVDAVLSAMEVLALDCPADRYYGKLRHHLETAGKPIGPNDMLIAAQALSLELTLVTANIDEFSRVPSLRVENWIN